MSSDRAVCLACIDGRVQLPLIEWITQEAGVRHVDMITEPGVDGRLAVGPEGALEDALKKVRLSIEKNNACHIFVSGHHDCKGNPVDRDKHHDHIREAVEHIRRHIPDVPVTGLWVNENWRAEPLNS